MSIDEELKEVQYEVKAVLIKVQRIIENVSGEPASLEDAAIAIHNHATPNSVFEMSKVPFDEAVQHTVNAKRRYREIDAITAQKYTGEKARLVAAMAAMGEWSCFGGQVPRHHHLAALWLSFFRYGKWMTQFFGQDAGLELRARRDIDPRRDTRIFAASHFLELHEEDQVQYPLTQGTFEYVGKLHGLSGSRLRDYYYSMEGKATLSWEKRFKRKPV